MHCSIITVMKMEDKGILLYIMTFHSFTLPTDVTQIFAPRLWRISNVSCLLLSSALSTYNQLAIIEFYTV